MIRLTAQEAAVFGEVYITPWYCIKPIEIKDGTFILPEHLIDDLERFKVGKAKLKGSKKIKMKEAQDKLKTLPIRKLEKDELIVSDINTDLS